MTDIEARAGRYGLPPVRWPDPWPGDYLTAMRAATWAQHQCAAKEFAVAAIRRAFVEGRDLSEAARGPRRGRRGRARRRCRHDRRGRPGDQARAPRGHRGGPCARRVRRSDGRCREPALLGRRSPRGGRSGVVGAVASPAVSHQPSGGEDERAGAIAAAMARCAGTGDSQAAAPPPGAEMSSNLEYVKRMPRQPAGRRGQVRRGPRQEHARHSPGGSASRRSTSAIRRTRSCSTSSSAGTTSAERAATGRTRTWRSTRRRKLIIGALDPRHTDVARSATCPDERRHASATRTARAASTSSRTRTRSNLRQIGDFVELPSGHTSSCIQKCKYIWTGGPARRDDQDWLGATFTPGRPSATAGRSGSPICATRATRRSSDQPIDLWRNDGYTDYSHDVDEDEQRHRVGRRARRHPRLRHQGQAPRPVPEPRARGDAVRPDPRRRRRLWDAARATRRAATMFMHNSGRPTDGAVRASGVKKDNVLIGTEEDFTTPVRRERPDRGVRPHGLLGRRAGPELHARRSRTG